jgi:hypothetical protein
LDKRLRAVENALRERTRPYPDVEHLSGLLQLSAPTSFRERVKQVIEGVNERQRLEAERNSAALRPVALDAAQPALPLGVPDWLASKS